MKWFIGAALILAAALLLESSLLAYAMYVLLGVLVLTRFLARSWLGSVTATRVCEATTAEVGDEVPVKVEIHNGGALPVPWLLIEDVLPASALLERPPRLRVKGKRLKIALIRGGATTTVKYTLRLAQRGYYQIGPVILESGDVFGLHRRFRVLTEPHFLLVYPRIVTLEGYELASRRPIGEVTLTHRLYEDPTRIAGVRPYEAGDPLNRVHWRATARTGVLHSKVYEPTTLAGATVLLDFHTAGYFARGEPFRSELAVTAAASLANAVYELGQQVGLVSNARDAVDRIAREGWDVDPKTRRAARRQGAMTDKSERLQPQIVATRRGAEQFQRIRETLARAELTDGLTFAELVLETTSRLPRDATVIAVLADATAEAATALGGLKRQGYAVTAVLVALEPAALETAHGRLAAEGIRDVRHLAREAALPTLCRQQVMGRGQFAMHSDGADETPEWMGQVPYETEE